MTPILVSPDGQQFLIGGAVMRLRDREHYARHCPKCDAQPGCPCVYTTGGQFHRDPSTGRYVENIPGAPMLRVHHERRR